MQSSKSVLEEKMDVSKDRCAVQSALLLADLKPERSVAIRMAQTERQQPMDLNRLETTRRHNIKGSEEYRRANADKNVAAGRAAWSNFHLNENVVEEDIPEGVAFNDGQSHRLNLQQALSSKDETTRAKGAGSQGRDSDKSGPSSHGHKIVKEVRFNSPLHDERSTSRARRGGLQGGRAGPVADRTSRSKVRMESEVQKRQIQRPIVRLPPVDTRVFLKPKSRRSALSSRDPPKQAQPGWGNVDQVNQREFMIRYEASFRKASQPSENSEQKGQTASNARCELTSSTNQGEQIISTTQGELVASTTHGEIVTSTTEGKLIRYVGMLGADSDSETEKVDLAGQTAQIVQLSPTSLREMSEIQEEFNKQGHGLFIQTDAPASSSILEEQAKPQNFLVVTKLRSWNELKTLFQLFEGVESAVLSFDHAQKIFLVRFCGVDHARMALDGIRSMKAGGVLLAKKADILLYNGSFLGISIEVSNLVEEPKLVHNQKTLLLRGIRASEGKDFFGLCDVGGLVSCVPAKGADPSKQTAVASFATYQEASRAFENSFSRRKGDFPNASVEWYFQTEEFWHLTKEEMCAGESEIRIDMDLAAAPVAVVQPVASSPMTEPLVRLQRSFERRRAADNAGAMQGSSKSAEESDGMVANQKTFAPPAKALSPNGKNASEDSLSASISPHSLQAKSQAPKVASPAKSERLNQSIDDQGRVQLALYFGIDESDDRITGVRNLARGVLGISNLARIDDAILKVCRERGFKVNDNMLNFTSYLQAARKEILASETLDKSRLSIGPMGQVVDHKIRPATLSTILGNIGGSRWAPTVPTPTPVVAEASPHSSSGRQRGGLAGSRYAITGTESSAGEQKENAPPARHIQLYEPKVGEDPLDTKAIFTRGRYISRGRPTDK